MLAVASTPYRFVNTRIDTYSSEPDDMELINESLQATIARDKRDAMEVIKAVLTGSVPDVRRCDGSSIAVNVASMADKLNSDVEDQREEARVAIKERDAFECEVKELRAIISSGDYSYDPVETVETSVAREPKKITTATLKLHLHDLEQARKAFVDAKTPESREQMLAALMSKISKAYKKSLSKPRRTQNSITRTTPTGDTPAIVVVDAPGPSMPAAADPPQSLAAAMQPAKPTTTAKVTYLASVVGLSIDKSKQVARHDCITNKEMQSTLSPKLADLKRLAAKALADHNSTLFKTIGKHTVAVWYVVARLPGTNQSPSVIINVGDLKKWVQSLADEEKGISSDQDVSRGVLTLYGGKRDQRDRFQPFVEGLHGVSFPYGKETVKFTEVITDEDLTKEEDTSGTSTGIESGLGSVAGLGSGPATDTHADTSSTNDTSAITGSGSGINTGGGTAEDPIEV
jgi:hypothetical protein